MKKTKQLTVIAPIGLHSRIEERIEKIEKKTMRYVSKNTFAINAVMRELDRLDELDEKSR